MKNLIVLIMVTSVVITFITSCDFDDAITSPDAEITSINGTWNLSNVKSEKHDQDFEPGQVFWEFDSISDKITIENNDKSNNSDHYYNLKSGKYPFELLQQAINDYIAIGGNEVGMISVHRDILIINENKKRDGNLENGYILTFER